MLLRHREAFVTQAWENAPTGNLDNSVQICKDAASVWVRWIAYHEGTKDAHVPPLFSLDSEELGIFVVKDLLNLLQDARNTILRHQLVWVVQFVEHVYCGDPSIRFVVSCKGQKSTKVKDGYVVDMLDLDEIEPTVTTQISHKGLSQRIKHYPKDLIDAIPESLKRPLGRRG